MSRDSALPPADQAQRRLALDVERSFIVQAPAGSGKTGLLTQRYLALLARVEQPEEIIAITFTRKAAAEMRERVLQALQASQAPGPKEDFERLTWQLAGAALEHSRKQGWDLPDHPQRLRIRTIDSLCQFIGRQLPVRSGFGDVPGVAEDARVLYRAAAGYVLAEVESDSALGDALSTLLRALDNQPAKLAELIAAMLARRDQWLRHVSDHGSRQETEQVLLHVIERHLVNLADGWDAAVASELPRLLRFAARNLDADHPMAAFREAASLPGSKPGALPAWKALADLLLTQAGSWRSGLTKSQGFPAGKQSPNADMKAAMGGLLEDLRGNERLRELLAGVTALPSPAYTDTEWRVIEALFEVLLNAAGLLRLVFAEQGQVDFTELALRAQEALGDEMAPTELALGLDYRLRHLLVDEFQDTSQSQHRLFRCLTAGWTPGDGRTLFLVGDPMQSIYGFREAEVGLFLNAWEGRLGEVVLEPLRLSVNFRSEAGIIDWVNLTFLRVFPTIDNKEEGAVSYAHSVAHQGAGRATATHVHPFLGRDDAAEAVRVGQLVEAARARGDKTAILARSKSHLAVIADRLRAAGSSFQAVEIGALKHRPVVMDLVSLTHALLHLGDRVGWLALLYGPFCGLGLADLSILAGEPGGSLDRALLDSVLDESCHAGLSEDGRRRLARVAPVLSDILHERGRRPVHEWVESAWLALGGPLTLTDEAAREDAEVFFHLLQRLASAGQPLTPERLDEEVERLSALPDPAAPDSLQLMTIHKAKGLEFDTVILPGLGKGTRSDEARLLYWLQTTDEHGEPELFFGPLKNRYDQQHSSTSEYIKQLEKRKSEFESGRLLYVAATRARSELHLLGHATVNRQGEMQASSGSLLSLLWPAVSECWDSLDGEPLPGPDVRATEAPGIPRFAVPPDWALPDPPAGVTPEPVLPEAAAERIPFEWAGDAARAVGTVVHRLLQHQAQSPRAGQDLFAARRTTIERMLRRQGVTATDLGHCMGRVELALEHAMRDPRGRWLLSPEHQESQCELPLSLCVDGGVRRLVIDRTFVDQEGTRWVIDYKTGIHSGGSVETFLDQEAERYREQLNRYVHALRKLENRPVRAALYFPLIEGGWRELEPGPE
jgi:ATP-dependent exoDNAse (exonuclease V) beta subunit